MHAAADAGRGVVELARIVARIGDDFLQGLCRQRGGADEKEKRHVGDLRNRCKIFQRVIRRLRLQIGRNNDRADIAVEQVISIGRCLCGNCRTDHSTTAAAVVDDDLLPEQGRQAQCQQACNDVHRLAGRIRHDDADRAVGIRLLRGCRVLNADHGHCHTENTNEFFHDIFPVIDSITPFLSC